MGSESFVVVSESFVVVSEVLCCGVGGYVVMSEG